MGRITDLITPARLEKMRSILLKRQWTLRVFMDYVYSLHNLSAIVRSCDAVNVGKLYYRHSSGAKLNAEVSLGAEKWLFIEQVEEIEQFYRQMKEEGYQIVSTDLTEKSINYREVDYTKPTLIVVGNEVDGVSEVTRQMADVNVIIPMYGMAQSLNVSVATAVILYEAERQRSLKGMYDTPSIPPELIEPTIEEWIKREVFRKK